MQPMQMSSLNTLQMQELNPQLTNGFKVNSIPNTPMQNPQQQSENLNSTLLNNIDYTDAENAKIIEQSLRETEILGDIPRKIPSTSNINQQMAKLNEQMQHPKLLPSQIPPFPNNHLNTNSNSNLNNNANNNSNHNSNNNSNNNLNDNSNKNSNNNLMNSVNNSLQDRYNIHEMYSNFPYPNKYSVLFNQNNILKFSILFVISVIFVLPTINELIYNISQKFVGNDTIPAILSGFLISASYFVVIHCVLDL